MTGIEGHQRADGIFRVCRTGRESKSPVAGKTCELCLWMLHHGTWLLVLLAVGCGGGMHAALPAEYEALAEESERLELDLTELSPGKQPFTVPNSGATQIARFRIESNVRQNGKFDRRVEYTIRENQRRIAKLDCFLRAPISYKNYTCYDETRTIRVSILVGEGIRIDVRTMRQGGRSLITHKSVRQSADSGASLTILAEALPEYPVCCGQNIALAITSATSAVLFVPRRGDARTLAVVGFLLAIAVQPPYVQSWGDR